MARGKARGEPGTLIVVAGPDARGKEMAVASVKRRYACRPGIDFPLRIMTRPAREGSDHLSVSRRAFQDMQREGAFALSWQAQGHDAAAPAAILDWLGAGHLVVLVANHEAAVKAHQLWPKVRVIELLAGPDGSRPFAATRSRLVSQHAHGPVHRIWHGGDIAEAVRRLSGLLDTLASASTSPLPAAAGRIEGRETTATQRKRAPLVWRSPESRL